MSNQLLSAAVDAAASEAEWDALIEAAGEDAELMAEWSRVWALRDAREGVTVAGGAAGRDFCAGVMSAIANEQPLPSNVVPFKQAAARPAVVSAPVRRAGSWRTLVPLSAAAGVVAAVLFVGGLRGPSTEGTAPMTAGISAPAVAGSTPVSWSGNEAGGTVVAEDEAKAAILNAYVMEHSNSLAERSMGGTLANARFAARTADYRPDAQ